MKTSSNRPQQGFTLIELMIGLALGLIASLAIFTTISTFESQRRTTGSGADMQQNGLMALYAIEQDIRMAGFGLIDASTAPGSMPCSKINAYSPASVYNSAPVAIANNASVGNDIIAISRLNSDTGGIVTGGNAAGLSATMNSGDATISLDTNKALSQNDFILVSQAGSPCSMFKVTSVAANPASGVGIANVGNATGDTTQTPTFPSTGYSAASAVVANLGPMANPTSATTFGTSDATSNPTITPTFVTTKYQINSSYDLIRSENQGATWNAVATNIVAIAAQYGIANPGSQSVSCWTDATGTACPATPATSGANWASPPLDDVKRIKAIRVAIVARSAQKSACTTTTAAPTSWPGGPVIDLTGNANWQCYRYKVYQTIIPIRNVIWGNL